MKNRVSKITEDYNKLKLISKTKIIIMYFLKNFKERKLKKKLDKKEKKQESFINVTQVCSKNIAILLKIMMQHKRMWRRKKKNLKQDKNIS